jgi:hypothetical protein
MFAVSTFIARSAALSALRSRAHRFVYHKLSLICNNPRGSRRDARRDEVEVHE